LSAHRYTGPRHLRPSGPRHALPAPPSYAHRTVACTGLAAAMIAGEALGVAMTAGTAGATTPDSFAQLRMCESSDNYATNTGNGYYGAYQFDVQTWRGLGYPGLPSQATPAVQDQAAEQLYQNRGWEPWPTCSVRLGLVDDRAASRSVSRPPLTPVVTPVAPVVAPPAVTPVVAPVATPVIAPVSAPVVAPPAAPVVPSAASAWDGSYLTTSDAGEVRADVKAWQTKMVAAGYPLTIDGQYGPASAAATTKFEAANKLHVETPGVVGPQVWGALFTG
jgi:hypothetical protein